jgi:hypothetical protein
MRKAILAAATLAALAAFPINVNAQDVVGGAIVGGATGAAVGGAVTGRPGGVAAGAAIGATTGAAIGADADYHYRHRDRVCWHDHWGHRRCHWR